MKYPLISFNYILIAGLCGLLFLFSCPASAQRTCGTPLAIKQALQKNPALVKKYQRILQLSSQKPPVQAQSIARGMPVAVIPVVVHIVLPNPQSVTDEQVLSQIKVINEDYQFENADTAHTPNVWKTIAGDMKIQFCLAARTPDGLPTNGIDRVQTNQRVFSINNAASDVKHASSGGADAWNTDDYLNIWVCNLSDNTLGIGTPPAIYPKDEQGVTIQYNAFGTTGNVLPEFNLGRSCTHELGHFFNLLHPWGDGDGSCSPGDYVEDTPPQSGPVYGAPSFPDIEDSCSPNFPGIMIDNFMGYCDDSVMNLFTQGQVNRAQTALFNLRSSLLSSNGCQPVVLKDEDAKLSSIASPIGKLCDSRVAPQVMLENIGNNTLQKVNINYQVDGGPVKTFQWTGSLHSFDSIAATLPASTTTIGQHQIRIFTTLPNGKPDEQTSNDTLASAFHVDPVETAPYEEGFEKNAFPPEGWTLNNPDHSLTWQKTAQAAHSGNYSVVMKNLDYQVNGAVDDLVSPVFNVQNADSAFLLFNIAAAVFSDPEGNNRFWDTLEVLISFDCGQTGTVLYKKWGADLITDSNLVSGEFVPNSNQWRRDSIDLTSFLGKGDFRLIFRNISNFENNIYLDDIQLKSKMVNPILKEKKIIVVPNPTQGDLYVEFLNRPPELKSVSIYNVAGQLIARKPASAMNNANRIIFDLSNVPDGVYFVKITYLGREIIKKVVKIK